MFKRSLFVTCALLLGTAATTAQAATQACLTPAEGEAMVSALLPDALRATGTACAGVLPANALIRRTSGPLIDGYQAEAERAWPLATTAIAKMFGEEGAPFAESALMRPMLSAMIVPAIVGKVKPKDCRTVERVVVLMAPLPPKNVSALAITILQLSQEDKKAKKDAFTICPTAP